MEEVFNIQELQNNKIKLDMPKFVCDNELSDKIPTPLLRRHHYYVFSGTAGSGKTSLAVSLLTTKGKNKIYKNVWHNIIVIMPIHSIQSLKNNPFEDIDQRKVFHELNEDVLDDITNMVCDFSDEDENTLLLIDDFASELKNSNIRKALNTLVNLRRHYKLSIWFLVQHTRFIPLDNRKLIDYLFLFKSSNKKEYDVVFEELLFYPRPVVDAVLRKVYRKKHDFLLVDTQANKLYRNFNLLKINYHNNKEDGTETKTNCKTNSECDTMQESKS